MAVMGTTALSLIIVGFFLEYISSQLLFLIIGICASFSSIIGFNNKFLRMNV